MRTQIAVLDDYQQAAFGFANWSAILEQADVSVFTDHLGDPEELINRLAQFDVICVMRERTPLPKQLLKRLTRLKLIVSTGTRNASIDTGAAAELGISVKYTGYIESGAPELSWALLMALLRHIPEESKNFREGRWQTTIGVDLKGKTLGIVGLGRIGAKMARFAKAFEMKVIAWSENLTEEKAHRAGAELVSKERLFKEADIVTLHLVLSDRSRHTVGERELGLMKPSAFLVNTSRGPLVDEKALLAVLESGAIAGAALDVFDTEPLPAEHPFRRLPNVLATSHIGYVTAETYKVFYQDTVNELQEWLKIQQ